MVKLKSLHMEPLSLGFSPCPNDCAVFDALVHGKIPLSGLNFEPVLEDVETLNQMAIAGRLQICKVSFGAFAQCWKHYQILDAGAALGRACGPLIVSAKKGQLRPGKPIEGTVAVPGLNTTATSLLKLAFGNQNDLVPMVFSKIEDAVLKGKADYGLLIHEGRFTYAAKKLHLAADLGLWWEQKFKQPLPLGAIVIKRNLDKDLKREVQYLIRESVAFNREFPRASMGYCKAHAQEMKPEVLKQHIDLYVNEYTLSLGHEGREAIRTYYSALYNGGFIPRLEPDIFVS